MKKKSDLHISLKSFEKEQIQLYEANKIPQINIKLGQRLRLVENYYVKFQ